MRYLAAIVLAFTLLGCESRKCLEQRCHTTLTAVPIGDTVILIPLDDCRCVRFEEALDGG